MRKKFISRNIINVQAQTIAERSSASYDDRLYILRIETDAEYYGQ